MIDLHAHLLPGVDDGAASEQDSLAMYDLARRDGTATVVLTPHQRHPRWPNEDAVSLREHFGRLRAALHGTVRLELGAELYVDSLLQEEIDAGAALSLAGSRYLLLEFPPHAASRARETVHELVVSGWRPILAHPERVAPWAENPALILRLADAGALVQLTAMSITGDFGARAQRCSRFLLEHGCVHFVASDAHDPVRRPPLLSPAFAAVAQGWGEEVARLLFVDNPAAVLEDRVLGERPLGGDSGSVP